MSFRAAKNHLSDCGSKPENNCMIYAHKFPINCGSVTLTTMSLHKRSWEPFFFPFPKRAHWIKYIIYFLPPHSKSMTGIAISLGKQLLFFMDFEKCRVKYFCAMARAWLCRVRPIKLVRHLNPSSVRSIRHLKSFQNSVVMLQSYCRNQFQSWNSEPEAS